MRNANGWLVASGLVLSLASVAVGQEFPPYPPQEPIAQGRAGIIAPDKENAPDGGRPEINTVEEMLEISGYTAPDALAYAALAAQAADGNWGAANYYHCKNTPGGTAINAPYPVPLEVFDGVYSIGNDANNIWALETSEGIILIDTLTTEEEAHGFIVGNMMRLGLDPQDIELIIISHGHRDHTGGLEYLRELTGARVAMSEADWQLAIESGDMSAMQEGDFYIEDGMEITLGDRTLTAVLTPGHTPGTVSLMIPLTWNGEEYMASYAGGQGTPRSLPEIVQWRASLNHLAVYNDLMGADVVMSNHTIGDDGLTKVAEMAADPSSNPYIVGREGVVGYYEAWSNCLSADIAQLVHDGQSFDPTTMLPIE